MSHLGRRLALLLLCLPAAHAGCDGCQPTPGAPAPKRQSQTQSQSQEPQREGPSDPAPATSPAPPSPQDWTLSPHEPGGIQLRYRGTKLADLDYRVRQPGGTRVESTAVATGAGTFELREVQGKKQVPLLKGHYTRSAQGLTFELAPLPGPAREIAIEFQFDFPASLRKARNLASGYALDQQGQHFRVELGSDGPLQVAFSPPVKKLEVGQEQPLVVRAWLHATTAQEASRPVNFTLTLPTGGRTLPAYAERLGRLDADFRSGLVDGEDIPVDLSFLNASDRPAGSHGPVTVQGEQLVFKDGTPARFWGTNVVAYALFQTSNAQVKQTARRLAAFGFNLVRIHHHDSAWVKPNVFPPAGATTQTLDPATMERLDFWIKSLKDEGIYVWLDLEVGRTYREGDNIPGYEELAGRGYAGKGMNFVNDRLAELMAKFAEQYLNHLNPHTGLRYREDPAVAGVLVTNENDLIKHGVGLAVEKGHPYHFSRFREFAVPFAQRHGLKLPQALQAWEPGEPALVMGALEERFYKASLQQLRSLGLQAPVAVGNYWGWSALDALPPLSVGDLMDVHSYGHEGELFQDPRYAGSFLNWIAGAALTGKPVTVTEWNTSLPARDRANHPLFVAAISALQGWDALMSYAYRQSPGWRSTDPYSIGHDPALMATMPQAALLYRRGDATGARHHYRLQLTYQDLYARKPKLRPIDLTALRTLMPQSQVSIDLPAIPALDLAALPPEDVSPADTTLVRDLDRSFIDPAAKVIHADTGELHWITGDTPSYVIDTARTQALLGFTQARPLQPENLRVDLQNPVAAVAVSSLDDTPLGKATQMLLSVGSQAVPNPHPEEPPGDVFLTQTLRGRVGLKSAQPELELVPLSPQGKTQAPLKAETQDGVHWFALPQAPISPWYLMRVPAPQAKPAK